MKRRFFAAAAGLLLAVFLAFPKDSGGENGGVWDCSVDCAQASAAESYVITYSETAVVSQRGVLTFQNRNDFDIAVHLLTNGAAERVTQIPAGGVSVLYEIEPGRTYTVGSHADVEENTPITLAVYDGARAEPR